MSALQNAVRTIIKDDGGNGSDNAIKQIEDAFYFSGYFKYKNRVEDLSTKQPDDIAIVGAPF